MKARVARIGIAAHEEFDSSKLTPEMKTAFEKGMADAWVDMAGQMKKLDSGQLTSGDCYGRRVDLKNNYLNRMTGIVVGGNAQPPAEVIYPILSIDSDPINRYLLNSPIHPNWVKDADGGYTFYIQNQSPGSGREPNWLPAPNGPFYMRVYLPSKAAQDGVWKAPKPTKVQS